MHICILYEEYYPLKYIVMKHNLLLNENREVIMKLRHLYALICKPKILPPPTRELDKQKIMQIVHDRISEGRPFMFARLGSIECDVCENVKYTYYEKRSNWKFITHKGQPNFINPFLLPLFSNNAGFFPSDDVCCLKRFYQLMVECMADVDILASWCFNEVCFQEEFKNSIKVDRELSMPLLTDTPWTLALEGKKVLVIHPFAETITNQYRRINKVFPNVTILPKFELSVIKAIQTSGGAKAQFKDWFEALQYMKDEIDKIDYEVCLLGCGAYGFPLAAHCKRRGKQAIHLGGGLQLLFGIIGNRWETDLGYINVHPYLPTYRNEYWVRPLLSETPIKSGDIENNCYW